MNKKIFFRMMGTVLLSTMAFGTINAQTKQPAGMRMEVAEAETDHGDYSVFTYKDTNEDDSFGYYLSVARTNKLLEGDEILGMEVLNIKEFAIWLGDNSDDALSTLDSILDLYSKDLDTSTEFRGRAVTGSGQLGEPTTTTCSVRKKPLGGKRLMFLFKSGGKQAHAYLTKQVVKELRMELKFDIKLHPKQHRKK